MLKLKNYSVVLTKNLNLNKTAIKFSFIKQQQTQAQSLRFQTNATPVAVKNENNSEILANKEWENAKPFKEIPTVSSLTVLKYLLPGSKYKNCGIDEMLEAFRKELGNVLYLPGFFGRPGIVFTHNVEDFEKVFRNEGIWPNRPGTDALHYHRHVHRADFFQGVEGLLGTQGKTWGDFRSVVNPVLMQPKNIRLYLRKISQVNKEFVERIRQIRDPKTLEVPDTFEKEINRWTLESISVVALDKHLGLLNTNRDNPLDKEIFQVLSDFFKYSLEVEVKPAIWKYYKTPSFKKLMKTLDIIVDITSSYINEAIQRLEEERKNGIPEKPEHEKSVLEKLIKFDKRVAVVMAMDLLMGGVDTTSSSFAALMLCMAKNPEKQEKMRQEVLKVLPQKDSEFDENSIKNMPYLRACIKESQRFYPLTPGNGRLPVKDVVISGYRVPKGTCISMCVTSLTRNSKHYSRPNEFLPERWLRSSQETANNSECPEAFKSSNPFLHLPFGFGPRTCIGRRIVELELELGIARMVRNYQIEFNYPTGNAFKSVMINVPNIPLKFKFIDLDY